MKALYIKLTAIILLLSTGTLLAQNARFAKSGIIEFEKSANMFAIMKKNLKKDDQGFMRQIYDQYIRTQPQFKKLKSTLTFGDNKTLFVPVEETTSSNFWGLGALVPQNNTIYTDLLAQQMIAQKKVYEETFLLKDSTRKINWKITSETREIAGYQCRRANAIVMDSIYVVAFYTDEIPVSGGPESFSGLPGMILGLALPHENITWFATKVTDTSVPAASLNPPKKGKQTTKQEFTKTLLTALKDWGDYAKEALKAYNL